MLDFFIPAYPFIERKRIKISKKWIELLKAYRRDLKIEKKNHQKIFFRYGDIAKKLRVFLGNLSFIPHKKNN